MQHYRMLGETTMEVDHFNPKLPYRQRHNYQNLRPATHHTNLAKSDNWPTRAEQRQGMRFLDCCREEDYGKHIFEDPMTHELVGATPAGRWHIEMCDLNADHYIRERADRAAYHRVATELKNVRLRGDLNEALEAVRRVQEHFDLMIPSIPPPPP